MLHTCTKSKIAILQTFFEKKIWKQIVLKCLYNVSSNLWRLLKTQKIEES